MGAMKNKLAMMAGAVLAAVVSVGAAISADAATGPWDADVAEFPLGSISHE